MTSRLDPPPTVVEDFNSPIWKTWFNTVYETLMSNRHLIGGTTATATTINKESVLIVTSNVTITLPDANVSEDEHYYIKRVTAVGAVTISSSDNIDVTSTASLAANYDAIHLFCDGTTWHIIGRE